MRQVGRLFIISIKIQYVIAEFPINIKNKYSSALEFLSNMF